MINNVRKLGNGKWNAIFQPNRDFLGLVCDSSCVQVFSCCIISVCAVFPKGNKKISKKDIILIL